jgi:hypothetical protein
VVQVGLDGAYLRATQLRRDDGTGGAAHVVRQGFTLDQGEQALVAVALARRQAADGMAEGKDRRLGDQGVK